MTVAVVIATFGDQEVWDSFASRAFTSVEWQTVKADQVCRVHAETLHEARNAAIRSSSTSHVIILDADDQLQPDYIEQMISDSGDVRIPAVQYRFDPPRRICPPFAIMPGVSLKNRNHVPIGAMFPRAAFDAVGGFEDYPIYEDWVFFSKIWLAGFRDFRINEKAVYWAYSRMNSRNCQTQHAAAMVRVIRDLFDREEKRCSDKLVSALSA